MKIIKVGTVHQLKIIAQLAEDIIPGHYSSFLPMEHIRYFINTYQTVAAIQEQLLHGFEYYLVTDSEKNIAYLGIEQKEATLILSKIYVLAEHRGQGIGNLLMKTVYERAAALNTNEIALYVVKDNDRAIDFYIKEGFSVAETLNKEYKNGYVVQEYKMTKQVK